MRLRYADQTRTNCPLTAIDRERQSNRHKKETYYGQTDITEPERDKGQ